jgi:hypothetical protein
MPIARLTCEADSAKLGPEAGGRKALATVSGQGELQGNES